MKKIFFVAILGLVVSAISITTFYFNYNVEKNDMSLLNLANVQALAQSENGSLYTRVTADCTIKITGKANATVTIAGIGTIKLDSNGEYTYTKEKGEVRCIAKGGEVCIPQNC